MHAMVSSQIVKNQPWSRTHILDIRIGIHARTSGLLASKVGRRELLNKYVGVMEDLGLNFRSAIIQLLYLPGSKPFKRGNWNIASLQQEFHLTIFTDIHCSIPIQFSLSFAFRGLCA